MAQNGKLKLDLQDVFDKRIQEKVDVSLRNLQLSHAPIFRNVDASKSIMIGDLFTAPQGNYQLVVDPPSYNPVNHFVLIKTTGVTEKMVALPVDITKIVRVTFPAFVKVAKELRRLMTTSANVFGFESKTGADLYNSLDDVRRAGTLNIATKTLSTTFNNGVSVLSLIKELRELRGDRFFAAVEKSLRDETINSVNSGLFHKVDESLHHLPPEFEGFEPAGSYKTDDQYGNLQLSFFRKADQFVADIDIDDAAGLGHIFQVLKNHFTGSPTHPYNIHEILIKHQHLDPGYRFDLKS